MAVNGVFYKDPFFGEPLRTSITISYFLSFNVVHKRFVDVPVTRAIVEEMVF